MPGTHHEESHFTASAAVRDVVIGMADGLTVPFALAAGISGAVAASANAARLVVTAGLAEIAAGSIAMGLGGYLAAKTDSEHYESEREREYRETIELPHVETEEVAKVFREYGLSDLQMAPVVSAICSNQNSWVDFMMRFELGLEPPDPRRANRSALTIAASYVVGGLIPLAPYMILGNVIIGSVVFDRDYRGGPGGIRVRQSPLHRHLPLERRLANRDHRRPGRRRRVRPRPPHQLNRHRRALPRSSVFLAVVARVFPALSAGRPEAFSVQRVGAGTARGKTRRRNTFRWFASITSKRRPS